MTRAFLAFGSNLGDRADHLAQAIKSLCNENTHLVSVSSIYETSPVGLVDQPDFLNLVAEFETDLPPADLLNQCQTIEAERGRVRTVRWGPRTLDIDILLYGDLRLSEESLTLPHPRMVERAFVMIPLAEIAPALLIESTPAAIIAKKLDSSGLRKAGRLPDPD